MSFYFETSDSNILKSNLHSSGDGIDPSNPVTLVGWTCIDKMEQNVLSRGMKIAQKDVTIRGKSIKIPEYNGK